MPTLTLRYEQTPIKEYHLKKGQSLTIGRKSTNDVVIENLGVSGHHAKIDSIDDNFLLTDLQSRNGTFVNEKLISSHWLKHGDLITIGKHTLAFAFAEGETRPPAADESAMEQTMVIETDQYQSMLAKSFPQAEQQIERQTVGVLSFLAGGAGDVKLTKKLTRVGKDSSCDVVVGGLMVGKVAATISQRPAGYYLSYVGGMAKPKVNGELVKESVKLEEFDIIEIGSSKLQFVTDYSYKK
ncbi:MAG TPA: FHA domain-containing protein [Syntrophobacteraceae bacterium]|nr:FHA domain-containing protein [Syntrophobacteraceae bacterium]